MSKLVNTDNLQYYTEKLRERDILPIKESVDLLDSSAHILAYGVVNGNTKNASSPILNLFQNTGIDTKGWMVDNEKSPSSQSVIVRVFNNEKSNQYWKDTTVKSEIGATLLVENIDGVLWQKVSSSGGIEGLQFSRSASYKEDGAFDKWNDWTSEPAESLEVIPVLASRVETIEETYRKCLDCMVIKTKDFYDSSATAYSKSPLEEQDLQLAGIGLQAGKRSFIFRVQKELDTKDIYAEEIITIGLHSLSNADDYGSDTSPVSDLFQIVTFYSSTLSNNNGFFTQTSGFSDTRYPCKLTYYRRIQTIFGLLSYGKWILLEESDVYPIQNSKKTITSGGVYNALANKADVSQVNSKVDISNLVVDIVMYRDDEGHYGLGQEEHSEEIIAALNRFIDTYSPGVKVPCCVTLHSDNTIYRAAGIVYSDVGQLDIAVVVLIGAKAFGAYGRKDDEQSDYVWSEDWRISYNDDKF